MAKAHTLVDNFNDNQVNTSLWTVTPGAGDAIREVNGRVEIRPPGNQTVGSYFEYLSVADYDLTDSEVRVELVRPLLSSSRTSTALTAFSSAGSLGLTINDRKLQCAIAQPSTTVLAEEYYDAERHRWLRLRESRGTVYWEISADGEAWTTMASRSPNPFDLTAVKLRIRAGTSATVPAPGIAIFDNFNVRNTTSPSRRVDERRLSARDVRVEAAELAAALRHDEHANNNDEASYPGYSFIGSYSKSLPHDALGDPDPVAYGTLLRALQSEDPGDFEEIRLASATALKLTNPQAGLAFDIEGPDAQAVTMPPAPRFESEQAAHEAGELYWMAVARDVPFADYGTSAIIADAAASLGSEFKSFGGSVPVTAQNVFRGVYSGEQAGPYVSQFLLKGNVDPRRPAGQGRNALDGFISYGARQIDQRQWTVLRREDLAPFNLQANYLTDWTGWLAVQNGEDRRGQDQFDLTQRRFIRSLRDGANFVHFDQVVDAFYNAAWILMSEPTGNQQTPQPLPSSSMLARPQIDLEFLKDHGNPYAPAGTTPGSRTQVGFGTFGPIHVLQALTEVLGRAIRAVWWQKWGVHRRLRPEEYGGRVHNHVTGARTYPLHPSIRDSLTLASTPSIPARLSEYFGPGKIFPNSYLLPQAYPEGAPTHPAYGAGHATGAGACATILKAFFDETRSFANPVQANAAGTELVPYTLPAGEPALSVGGELNKLAGNIALFRSAAGVHWRSDYTESLPFGEAIAIRLLQEMSLGFNEDDAFFALTRFDGQKIRIFDGKVELFEP